MELLRTATAEKNCVSAYRQITNGIRTLLMDDAFPVGDPLPTVRELAAEAQAFRHRLRAICRAVTDGEPTLTLLLQYADLPLLSRHEVTQERRWPHVPRNTGESIGELTSVRIGRVM
jgi:hypothetical protein